MTDGTQEPAHPVETPPAALPPEPAASPQPAVAVASSARPGKLRRFFNWFWRGRELRELRRDAAADSPRVRQLAGRARLLFELGERTRRPAEPLPFPGDAAAAELFRQSAYWAARAVAGTQGAGAGEPWSALDARLVDKAVGNERAAEVTRLIETGDFVETWELPEEQRSLRATELANVAKTLIDELAWQTRARDALWIQRVLRIALLLAVILGAVSGVRWVMDRSEQGRDLAVGKPWRASSAMSGVGCTSPLQECGESTDYFFHSTDENGPWLEIDLGKPTTFTGVRVENRRDCCFDRAVPLVVEVGDSPQQFREVARRTSSFSSWLASFSPTKARYVRLRVPRQSLLHLSRVRVLR